MAFAGKITKFLILTGLLALAAIAPALSAEKQSPQTQAQLQYSFAPVVKKAAPAVVNVFARRIIVERVNPFFNDPFFKRFFGDHGFGIPRERTQNSLGSGVIVDGNGTIITNYHVIRGGDEFKVVLADRREFEAEVILEDERSDLAVLKINTRGEKLPSLSFSDSDALEVGDFVLAIGNPFGVGQTVTSGIVSALARTQVGISDYQFFIQTDAAINPGNSGGALINVDGDLVGINTAIYSRTGGSIGIGFAIPANMVRLVVDSALKGGQRVQRPWFGARMQPVTADIAESLGLARPVGALIQHIVPDSPAERAGLKQGDVIQEIDGQIVTDPEALKYRFATKGIGGKVTLTYERGGKNYDTSVKLMSAPETIPRDETLIRGSSPLAGAVIANISPALAEEIGLPHSEQGVVILEVQSATPAARIRLRAGDIVRELEDKTITSVRQLEKYLSQNRDRWNIMIQRGERLLELSIRG